MCKKTCICYYEFSKTLISLVEEFKKPFGVKAPGINLRRPYAGFVKLPGAF